MLLAAREKDAITHTLALPLFGVGALLGILVGLFICVATGGVGALLIGAAICTGISLGSAIGELIGSLLPGVNVGKIDKGCRSVLIGLRYAARAKADLGACGWHGKEKIAEGARTVYIGYYPAARQNDKGCCGFKIKEGCDTVVVGGPKSTFEKVRGEVPWQLQVATLVLGLIGPGTLMRLAGMGLWAITARLVGGLVGGISGGMLGEWMGGMLFGEDSAGQKLMGFCGGLLGSILGFRIAHNRVPMYPRGNRNTRAMADEAAGLLDKANDQYRAVTSRPPAERPPRPSLRDVPERDGSRRLTKTERRQRLERLQQEWEAQYGGDPMGNALHPDNCRAVGVAELQNGNVVVAASGSESVAKAHTIIVRGLNRPHVSAAPARAAEPYPGGRFAQLWDRTAVKLRLRPPTAQNCVEGKLYTEAAKQGSRVKAMTVRWRGAAADNPHPLSPGSMEMGPCDSCLSRQAGRVLGGKVVLYDNARLSSFVTSGAAGGQAVDHVGETGLGLEEQR
ncbi:MAG: PAAR domain-containing protein [Deltaproteobacteria bacterium]|nr:PAAR domain-containing protein [Deltaproteobacteria bacterium]